MNFSESTGLSIPADRFLPWVFCEWTLQKEEHNLIIYTLEPSPIGPSVLCNTHRPTEPDDVYLNRTSEVTSRQSIKNVKFESRSRCCRTFWRRLTSIRSTFISMIPQLTSNSTDCYTLARWDQSSWILFMDMRLNQKTTNGLHWLTE